MRGKLFWIWNLESVFTGSRKAYYSSLFSVPDGNNLYVDPLTPSQLEMQQPSDAEQRNYVSVCSDCASEGMEK